MKLKVNLFGQRHSLFKVELTKQQLDDYTEVADKIKLSLAEALADPYFYHRLKNKKIGSWSDLNTNVIYSGLSSEHNHSVEIWHFRKKVAKFSMSDLQNEMLLFPLYNSKVMQVDDTKLKGYFIAQREVGLVGCYVLDVENFNIDLMSFDIYNIGTQRLLYNATYNNEPMPTGKLDSTIILQAGYKL